MGSNVFGNPITQATVMAMPEFYDKEVRNIERARVAMELKNAEGKDVNARLFVEKCWKIKNQDGTMCLIYNATGRTIKLAARREWDSNIAGAPFPIIIQNGQWGAFFHEKGGQYSSAAVVYDGYSTDGSSMCQYVLAWRNKTNEESQVFNEIRPLGYYSPSTGEGVWNPLRDALNANRSVFHEVQDSDCVAFASMSSTDPRVFEAILSVRGAL